jgi:hypothetical protein
VRIFLFHFTYWSIFNFVESVLFLSLYLIVLDEKKKLCVIKYLVANESQLRYLCIFDVFYVHFI